MIQELIGQSLTPIALPQAAREPRTLTQLQSVLKRIKAAALREGEDPEAPDFGRGIDCAAGDFECLEPTSAHGPGSNQFAVR